MHRYYENTPLFDKCLEAFIEWYERTYKNTHVHAVCYWDEIPFEMQYTVYEDFFLFNGIQVGLEEHHRHDFSILGYQPVINYTITQDPMPIHLARVEVVREAGEKYNEIVKQLNKDWDKLKGAGLGEKLRGEW